MTDHNKIIIPPQHMEKIIIMLNAGVFDFQNGKIEINCLNGQIQVININSRAYKRVSL